MRETKLHTCLYSIEAPGHRSERTFVSPDGGERKVDCAAARLKPADAITDIESLMLSKELNNKR